MVCDLVQLWARGPNFLAAMMAALSLWLTSLLLAPPWTTSCFTRGARYGRCASSWPSSQELWGRLRRLWCASWRRRHMGEWRWMPHPGVTWPRAWTTSNRDGPSNIPDGAMEVVAFTVRGHPIWSVSIRSRGCHRWPHVPRLSEKTIYVHW